MTTNKAPSSTPTPPPAPEQSGDTSGLAIASLVLGAVSLTGFGIVTGIPAIITGAMALRKGPKDRAMSIAGIIMGAVATLLTILFVGLVILFTVLLAMSDPASFHESVPTMESEFHLESSRT